MITRYVDVVAIEFKFFIKIFLLLLFRLQFNVVDLSVDHLTSVTDEVGQNDSTPVDFFHKVFSQSTNESGSVFNDNKNSFSDNNHHNRSGQIYSFETNNSTNTQNSVTRSKIATLLKILRFVNLMAQATNTLNDGMMQNFSQSETRSVTSWLGFKRSSFSRKHQQQQKPSNNRQQSPQHQPTPPPKQSQIIQTDQTKISQPFKPLPLKLIPISPPNTYPMAKLPTSATDPNPFLFFPPITDTSDIDYWLKFLEDTKFDERIMSILLDRKHDFPSFQSKKNKKTKTNFKNTDDNNNINNNRKKYSHFNNNNNSGYLNDDNNNNNDGAIQNDINHDDDIDTMRSKKIFNKQTISHEYESSPRCDKFTEDICIDDFEYPEHAILDEIQKRKEIFQLMYAEVNGDVPLVDGIPKDLDESFSQDYYYSNNESGSDDYDGYTPNNHNNNDSNKPDQIDQGESNNEFGQMNQNGYVCRSEVLYAKPKLAKNLKKKWRVIVNAGEFTQTIRMEKCNKANSECRFIPGHKYGTRCAQVHSIHRLLVFEKGKGFYIDSFRIPTACTCHIHSIKSSSDSGESSINVQKIKNQSNPFQNDHSLWSFLNANGDQTSYNNADKLLFFPETAPGQSHHPHRTLSPFDVNHLLNNQELSKYLPPLTPENILKMLGGFADPQIHNVDQQHNQQQFNNNFDTIKSNYPRDHQFSFPEKLNFNENQKVFHVPEIPRPQQQFTSSTIGNPQNHQQAPVVQVIHMPVSTGLVAMDSLDNGMNSKLNTMTWPFGPDTNADSRYLISASNNYSQSQIKFENNSSMISTPPPTSIPATQKTTIRTTTTTTTTEEPLNNPVAGTGNGKQEEREVEEEEEDQDQEDNKKKSLKRNKINFSYHPILEYIVN